MPRVLFVSYVFPPMAAGGAIRTGQLARYLPEHGWDVTVLTATCSPAAAIDMKALAALPKSIHVERAWAPNQRLGSMRASAQLRHGVRGFLRRSAIGAAKLLVVPDRQVSWYPSAVRTGRRLLDETPHDVVLASYGPGTSLLVGRRLAEAAELPLVLDFRDLWSDLPLDVFATGWHRARAARMERRCVAAARRIVCVSDRMAAHLAERHGRSTSEVVAIPNGFDPAQVGRHADAGPRHADPCAPAGRPRPFRLVYAGAVHRFQAVDPFLAALRGAIDGGEIERAAVEVEFVGNLDPDVSRRSGLQDIVRCRPFVPHADVPAVLARADALLLLEQPGYWGEFSYSAKVFDYVITGKPVLALVEDPGNSANLLRELGTGVMVAPLDEAAIRRALVALVTGPPTPARNVDTSVDPLNRFDRRTLAGQLSDVLQDALGD